MPHWIVAELQRPSRRVSPARKADPISRENRSAPVAALVVSVLNMALDKLDPRLIAQLALIHAQALAASSAAAQTRMAQKKMSIPR